MDVRELAPGLWRWTAPHPAWKPENDKPGGWGRMVASISYEPGNDVRRASDASLVLIDPLAPPDGSADADLFWRHLDEDVERVGLPVAVLIANEFHGRSAQAVYDRYHAKTGASIWAHEDAVGKLACRVSDPYDAQRSLPSGVQAHAIANPMPGEVTYFIPEHGALVVADVFIGSGPGQVRLAPASWAEPDDASQRHYKDAFRTTVRKLLALPIEKLLASHSEPIMTGARDVIRDALEAPAWGEQAS